ncbi:Hypothetical predicted protein [Mytilus galloprovincialis]|uniref:Uncharacterized protein n=1 Tax=Mytilus galloprovincialis TaxID=29158 RepID=A0A8B6BR91_MYTGA|nr:Hypothetical predicted protein [Mytilus galloprovincialis]
MASNVVFQQTVNKSGETEFRVKFGRNKSLVFRKHEQFYYLDLYDNKFGKARFNGICLGLDELDFILSIRRDLDSLSSVFPAGKAAEDILIPVEEKMQVLMDYIVLLESVEGVDN